MSLAQNPHIIMNKSNIPITRELLIQIGFDSMEYNKGAFTRYFIECTPPKYKVEYILAFDILPDGSIYQKFWLPHYTGGNAHSFICENLADLRHLYKMITGNSMPRTVEPNPKLNSDIFTIGKILMRHADGCIVIVKGGVIDRHFAATVIVGNEYDKAATEYSDFCTLDGWWDVSDEFLNFSKSY